MSKFTREYIDLTAKLTAAMEGSNMAKTSGVPQGIAECDYRALRNVVFEWFTEQGATIEDAVRVLESLKKEVFFQKCAGVTHKEW
ncbi:hypothetical protein [Brevibacillus laterosporus]|uniref:hypothetical protein n=1 Tax=Brevibacillus laterosporus TaxID=1465 RepID=UPI002650C8D6|nr:hypothetical protein [Brevibacillus laterosporus]MDN9010008.1 hypothetical protein [Brevibacillus laterosporus]MDO0940610.1 hypothetical protein [Brevibacillus laterosporus]